MSISNVLNLDGGVCCVKQIVSCDDDWQRGRQPHHHFQSKRSREEEEGGPSCCRQLLRALLLRQRDVGDRQQQRQGPRQQRQQQQRQRLHRRIRRISSRVLLSGAQLPPEAEDAGRGASRAGILVHSSLLDLIISNFLSPPLPPLKRTSIPWWCPTPPTATATPSR